MIHIKIDNKKVVKIPESYSEITIDEYIKIWHILHEYKTIEPAEGEELNDAQILQNQNNEREVTVTLVAHLLGLSKKEAKMVKFEQAEVLINTFNNFINNQPLNKVVKNKGATHFVHEGTMYYYPKPDFEDMTFGEYCELQQLQSTFGKETKNRFDFIPQQMAISCRMKGEKKDSYDLEERTKLFGSITMDIVLAYSFFLSSRVKLLERNIPSFSKKLQADSIPKQNTSLKDMDGLIPYTNLRKMESLQKDGSTMQ